MNPSLRLTRELVDQIVFGMENQEREYVLDTEEGSVIPADQAHPDAEKDRYLSLPEWRSVDGYNLMEQFVASLHNPIFRERLRAILASGRGVFRQFKDTIHERQEIERLWFSFKDRKMRELVADWYNELREREGLERLEAIVAETQTDQLIETDFVFRPATPDDLELIDQLDRDAFDEVFPETDSETVQLYYDHHRSGMPELSAPESTVLVTETQGADFAGFLWAVVRHGEEVTVSFVEQVYILPEFRGFGLARELFRTYCRQAHREGASGINLPLYGTSLDLEPNFTNYGLARQSVRLTMDVDQWYRSEIG